MARTRAGKKLLTQKRKAPVFLNWPFSFLKIIGRLVYKSPYYLGRIFLFVIKKSPQLLLLVKKGWHYLLPLFLFFCFSFYFYQTILKDLPRPNRLIYRQQPVSTKIYDRRGQLLFTIFDGSQNRSLVKLEEIPQQVKWATIAIEDQDFYQHSGFSLSGIIRAVFRNLSHSSLEGGSTITQQLIKNALLTSEKTIKRKVKEIILSLQAELIFSKEEILQMYFNEVPYGGTAYGIEQAAQTYLGKSIKDVNLAEAALLAGLPAAPSQFSPFGANPQLTLSRQHQVLDRMVKEGFISQEQAQDAKKEKIILAPQRTNIKAPHFVMYIKDLLVQEYGLRQVEQGGLLVTTSLDLQLQETAQRIVSQEVAELASLRVGNGAALVTNPQTGEILAMVGSKDYFNSREDGNVNITTSLRQPGSAIKIITYSLALTNGFTPATIISDSPVTYYSPGAKPYSPVNYDRRFHGQVTLRTAFACSYNVPAVKTLSLLGVKKMIDLAQQMGITTWSEPNRYGLALTLGAGEVKMTEMAVAYGSLANLGLKKELQPILKITDSQGKSLDFPQSAPAERVLSPQAAYLITDILKDNQARTPAFGASSLLIIPNQEVAVKTGTTNDKRDNWTFGYTTDRLVAAWVGNNDNQPMSAVASGVTGASSIWNKIITQVLKDEPKHQFFPPENLVKIEICSQNGLLPCKGCPTREEYFIPGTEPKYHCRSGETEKKNQDQEKERDKILEGVNTQRE